MDDEPRKPRRPSSIQKMTTWGVVHAGLAMAPNRRIEITAPLGARGLRITLIDPSNSFEVYEDVVGDEDPSRVALRLLQLADE